MTPYSPRSPSHPPYRRFTASIAAILSFALVAAIILSPSTSAGETNGTPVTAPETVTSPVLPPLTMAEADSRIDIARRMLEGGIYDRALELADSILSHPDASGGIGHEETEQWLQRREAARFVRERSLFGLATTEDAYLDVAQDMVQLANNRYRLQESAYYVQAAYWAARAFEMAGDYRAAVDYYSRVGGVTLPPGMEGDAAQKMSGCLRKLADEIPYPGTLRDRQRRDRLLNQAITELDRARLAFPVGNRRKEIELDLIALRMARREEQYIREAATEAEAYIESDPAKDELHARAILYRGQAASMLGIPAEAVTWYAKAMEEDNASPDDLLAARQGLALAYLELTEAAAPDERGRLLRLAGATLDTALKNADASPKWDGARLTKARVQLLLDQPSSSLATLAPIISRHSFSPMAWQLAGTAELRRGRLSEAIRLLYPATRPSNPNQELRYPASREAAQAADLRRNYGLALALNHQASRMLRRDRLYNSLLTSEFAAMDTFLKMGKMGGPVSLSGDRDLLASDLETPIVSAKEEQDKAGRAVATGLVAFLQGGGDPDTAYDLAIQAETADSWFRDSVEDLELAIGMIAHLRIRKPAGITDSTLSSRLGDARHALALARGARILAADAPDNAAIDRALGDFAAAAASFQEASSGGTSLQDSLNQGMVNLESGAFLMELSRRWERGPYAGRAMAWREEARQRIEASLRPFNQAISTSGPGGVAARRARWSRGRALELMGEWRGAAADYLSLMNNSEMPRILRANSARRWAVCMGNLGENRAALTRLAVFTEIDAEAALLAGHLAEDAEFPREAYQQYIFAADPQSPSIQPATPNRVRDAAYHAARLALRSPNDTNPYQPAEQVKEAARELLIKNITEDLANEWTVRMLVLLSDSWLEEPGGGRRAFEFYQGILSRQGIPRAAERTLYLLSGKALGKEGEYASALDQLDAARELLDDSATSRPDAAMVTLETARVYRSQKRRDDALRAYADVYAVYPEQSDASDAARTESAILLLESGRANEREVEQARGILSGLRDQIQVQKIMRDYGIH